MYRFNTQLRLMDFDASSFKLSESNPWVILADEIPWDDIELRYSKMFSKGGKVAIKARAAFGALIIKGVYRSTNRNLILAIRENPYLQYFIGMAGFCDYCPFSEYSVARFEKRFSHEDVQKYIDRYISLLEDYR